MAKKYTSEELNDLSRQALILLSMQDQMDANMEKLTERIRKELSTALIAETATHTNTRIIKFLTKSFYISFFCSISDS